MSGWDTYWAAQQADIQYRESETMRRVGALADLLASKCPLRELLGAIQKPMTEDEQR